MKRLFFSSFVIGLMLLSLSSCDKNDSGIYSSPSVPEPSFNWGCDLSTLKSEMESKGIIYSSGVYASGGSYQYFNYEAFEYLCCMDDNEGYCSCSCSVFSPSKVKETMAYYSNNSNFIKIGEKSYNGGTIYAFQTKDYKTFIYAQAMDAYNSCSIHYYSKTLVNSWRYWLELF